MFNAAELSMLRLACLAAAAESREQGHDQQADEFHRLADKCEN